MSEQPAGADSPGGLAARSDQPKDDVPHKPKDEVLQVKAFVTEQHTGGHGVKKAFSAWLHKIGWKMEMTPIGSRWDSDNIAMRLFWRPFWIQ